MEFFDLLDEAGNKTGNIKAREAVHQDGDWHRTVHVWIVNNNDEILLQKRSPNKDSYPNMWDISSAGHLALGDDSLSCAVREIKEELGLDISPSQLTFIGTKKSKRRYNSTFIDNEFNDIYLLRISFNIKNLCLQKEEVSEVRLVSINEFRTMIKANDKTLLMHGDEFEMLFKALGYRL